MKKKLTSLLLVFAMCLSLGTVAFAEERQIVEEKLIIYDIDEITDNDLKENPTLALFLSSVNYIDASVQPYSVNGSPVEDSEAGHIYDRYEVDSWGNRYDYYCWPIVYYHLSDLDSNATWYSTLTMAGEVYYNGNATSLTTNKFDIRNMKFGIGVGSNDAYFNKVENVSVKSSGADVNIDFMSIGSLVASFTGYVTASTILALLSTISVSSKDPDNYKFSVDSNNVVFQFNNSTRLEEHNDIARVEFEINRHSEISNQSTVPVAMSWSYDIYYHGVTSINEKVDSDAIECSDSVIIYPNI